MIILIHDYFTWVSFEHIVFFFIKIYLINYDMAQKINAKIRIKILLPIFDNFLNIKPWYIDLIY